MNLQSGAGVSQLSPFSKMLFICSMIVQLAVLQAVFVDANDFIRAFSGLIPLIHPPFL